MGGSRVYENFRGRFCSQVSKELVKRSKKQCMERYEFLEEQLALKALNG